MDEAMGGFGGGDLVCPGQNIGTEARQFAALIFHILNTAENVNQSAAI